MSAELDMEVALKVMGWKAEIINNFCFIDNKEDVCPMYKYKKPIFMFIPSFNLDDAFLVVDNLRERRQTTGGWWLSLRQIAGVPDEWEAIFTFGGMATVHKRIVAISDTAPKAICIAALEVIKYMEAKK
jgi:hypothetical protein